MDAATFQNILIGSIGTLLGAVGWWIASSLHDLTRSVQELNINVALVVQRVDDHQKRIERLEQERIS